MQWRNEQMYHLRQSDKLTKEKQDIYFDEIISKLFEQENPSQILFSYLENDICVGYGGLVHINWIDKNAELSFIMDTALEVKFFHFHWLNYLKLIQNVAFFDLNLHKIYTFAFDLRPHLFPILEKEGFNEEAVLKEHYFWNNEYHNCIIHTKFNRMIQ
jgi:RimJ/RimL family protein N-acetyltransferase